jgi:hypothetical protein
VVAVFVIAWRRRVLLIDAEKMLWIWMAVLFIVFAIPSQRSARYLLEAMPGVAILCALNWRRLPRWTFVLSLIASGMVLALLGFLAWSLQKDVTGMYGWRYGLVVGGSLALVILGVLDTRLTRNAVNVLTLLTYLALAVFLRPFDNGLGTYSQATQRYVQNKDVWVPCNFRAHDEGDRFMFPNARVHGYDERWNLKPAELAARYHLFTLQLPLEAKSCAGCKVIAQRFEIRGRQSPEELRAMLKGDVFRYLFVKELLVESAHVDADIPDANKEGCR